VECKDTHGRRRINDLVRMMDRFNEIPPEDYIPLDCGTSPNPKATFRNDNQFTGKSVLKTIEDSKILSALLGKHSDNDTGFALPAVDLLSRILHKLNAPQSIPDDYRRANPDFQGKTLLDVISAEMDNVSPTLLKQTDKVNFTFMNWVFDFLFKPLRSERDSLATKFGAIVHVAAQTIQDKDFVKTFKKDIANLLDAADKRFARINVEQILRGLNAVMALNDNPDPRKNTLAIFINNTLHGLALLSDSETIKGMLIAMINMDAKAIKDYTLWNNDLITILTTNMYGQKRDTADVKTSALRTLLFMVKAADVESHLVLAGMDTGFPLLNMVDSPDHPYNEQGTVKNRTVNIGQWAIGEIVTAIRWGREGKIILNGQNVYMDTFQAFDWIMYKKRYDLRLVGIRMMSFEGMAEMLSSKMVKFFIPQTINDTFPALLNLGGGMTDAEYNRGAFNGFTNVSWRERYGTAGRRHKLLALSAPLMTFFWNNKDASGKQRSGDMIQALGGFNEIPLPPVYKALNKNNPEATLRKDNYPSVIRIIEDDILIDLMGRDEIDIVTPALNLVINVVNKLNQKNSVPPEYRKNHPDFLGNTALDVLFNEMNIKGYKWTSREVSDNIQNTLDTLFSIKSGESQNLITRYQTYLQLLMNHLYPSSEQLKP